MMKVLMIEHFLPGNVYTKELCHYLCDDCDVTVLTKRNYVDDGKGRWKVKSCLFYQDLNNKCKSFFYILLGWLHIMTELLFGGYDVVHIQTFKVDSVEMRIYKMFAAARLVHTAHNILPHEAKEEDKKKYKQFYQTCNLIIVHNEYCKKKLEREYGINEKVKVIPHGIYQTQARTGSEKSLTKDGSGKIEVLQFGMIRTYKGVDILLKALAKIDEQTRRSIHVTIAGKQYQALNEENYEEIISKFGITDIVSFHPQRISDEEMDVLFQAADVCIFPYRQVYGSGALLMAYTYQKPVIVSNIPALVEETDHGKTGLIFESENPEDLAACIGKFAAMPDKKKKEFEAQIKRLVDEKYNWETSAGLLAKYYKECIGQLK